MEKTRSPKLMLKLAFKRLKEVDEEFGDFLTTLEEQSRTFGSSNLLGFYRSYYKRYKKAKALLGELEEIVQLCEKIVAQSPGTILEDGTTPEFVKALALMLQGRVHLQTAFAMRSGIDRRKFARTAVQYYQQSVESCPTQQAFFELSLAFQILKQHEEEIKALQMCIELDEESDLAVEAADRLEKMGYL